jgi:gamma-polyglutamate synthase
MIVVLITLFFLLYLAVEKKQHTRRLNVVPCRILVTGTRGKSSVVRLIYAGISEHKTTVAKVTGSKAVFINPDGIERSIRRNGPANLLEQKRVLKWARKVKPDVLILESMALRPELQKIESHSLIKPHISVICTIGADHLDVMGTDESEILNSYLTNLYPPSQKIISSEMYDSVLLNPQKNIFGQAQLESPILFSIKKALSYIEHDQNIILAHSTCERLGVTKDKITKGMKKTKPDAGALRIVFTKMSDHKVAFVNAFAANDPGSIKNIWGLLGTKLDFASKQIIVIINTRKDRPHRTIQLSNLLKDGLFANHYIVTGTNIEFFINSQQEALAEKSFFAIGGKKAKKILHKIESLIEQDSIIIGIGNYSGVAASLLAAFQEREMKDQ